MSLIANQKAEGKIRMILGQQYFLAAQEQKRSMWVALAHGAAVLEIQAHLAKGGVTWRDRHGLTHPASVRQAAERLQKHLEGRGISLATSACYTYAHAAKMLTQKEKDLLMEKLVPARDLVWIVSKHCNRGRLFRDLASGALVPPYHFKRKQWGDGGREEDDGKAAQEDAFEVNPNRPGRLTRMLETAAGVTPGDPGSGDVVVIPVRREALLDAKGLATKLIVVAIRYAAAGRGEEMREAIEMMRSERGEA